MKRFRGITWFFLAVGVFFFGWYVKRQIQPVPPPSWYHPRFCAGERETSDLYDDNEVSHGRFIYEKITGCSAEVVLPEEWTKWRIQTANPEKQDDRMEISCSDGRVIFPLALPSTPFNMVACGGDYKNQHSLRVQSNVDLRFIRTAGGPPPADSSPR